MASTLLVENVADQVVTAARTATGDRLRSVTYFTRTDYDQLYLREDLERDADVMSFIGHEWHDFKNTRDAYRSSELGAYRHTIRVFENGYLLRITTDRDGVFVTTDGLTMSDFEAVASAVVAVLEDR
ncbi:DUF7522 family protein [Halococcus hamelinensis]|jgi:hypothetical protein|uniref:Uncharacterized protein n=1 Tax=Halococcus hamelinensis 100A6 TaxID=1132509 RepID=M0LST8_9EURY|nr:hypothetical protein [Halococcus hamelinensis]EMA36617.1 hypothetical protein C447_15206 [Halococcus hamelinensis 100A6]